MKSCIALLLTIFAFSTTQAAQWHMAGMEPKSCTVIDLEKVIHSGNQVNYDRISVNIDETLFYDTMIVNIQGNCLGRNVEYKSVSFYKHGRKIDSVKLRGKIIYPNSGSAEESALQWACFGPEKGKNTFLTEIDEPMDIVQPLRQRLFELQNDSTFWSLVNQK